MNDEKLIELVHNHPVLYDFSNPKYMDTEFKNGVWSKIGMEMQTNGLLCKTRWSNIRDNYRKSLKKTKTVSGNKAVKPYKYSQQLSFLTTFFEDRENITNVNDELTHQDFSGNDDVNEDINDVTIAANTPVTMETQMHTPPSSTQQSYIPSSSLRKRKHLRLSAPPTKTAAATVIEYLVKKNESMASHPPLPPQHPVDAFLTGIAPPLKKLPPQYWHYAKAEIFAAVQKYEFKMLMDQQQFTESCPISASPSPFLYSEPPSPTGRKHVSPSGGTCIQESSPDQNQQEAKLTKLTESVAD